MMFWFVAHQRKLKTGYIDLSKRRVSPEDIIKCEERYMKAKTVASIMRHVASRLPSVDADEATEGADVATKEAQDAGSEVAVSAVGSSEEERLEKLYDQIAWPLGRKYGHPYEAFKLALT